MSASRNAIASLADGTRDGRLVFVSDDRKTYRIASQPNLRTALDSDHFEPSGPIRDLAGQRLHAVLPRAAGFLDASAYVNHVDLVRKARGAVMPDAFWSDPLMYQGCSDPIMSPTRAIPWADGWGVDCEAEIAVITEFVPMGIAADKAGDHVAYVTVINDVSLRGLIPDELAKGFGFVQSKPPSAMAPFAMRPGALPGWDNGKLSGTLCIDINGVPLGRVEAGEDMTFDFGTLIAHAAKTRPLMPGTVIGSGTVSNRDTDGGPGRTIADGGRGYACIAEQRMVETIQTGEPHTPFLMPGDRVKIWMDHDGISLFGDINQTVEEF